MTSVWSGHEASPWPASFELEAPGPTFDQESPFPAAATTAGTTASEYLAPAGNGPPAAHLVLAHESVAEAAVRQSIASGTRDPDVLTEIALRAHDARPDTPAPLLDPTSPPAQAQREAVREQIVVPLLRSGGAAAPAGELWLPRAERVQNAKAAGGRYVDSPWRFVFHTVEAEPSAHGFRALAARHANPPHLWAMPKADLVLQTVPLNRSAYALARPGTIQTNRLHAVQVEVWGYAAKMGDVDPDFLRWLADRVLVPVARLVPINLERVEPTRGRSAYGRNGAGRLTPAEWNAFNGVCGHQHVPDNDHWDPGKLDLTAIATRARHTLGPTGGVHREDEAFADDAAFAEGAASGHDGASFVAEQDEAGEGERAANGLDRQSVGQANGYEANRYGAGGYEADYEAAGLEAGMATQTQEQLAPTPPGAVAPPQPPLTKPVDQTRRCCMLGSSHLRGKDTAGGFYRGVIPGTPGTVYTGGAGFVDLGHLWQVVEVTGWVYQNIHAAQGKAGTVIRTSEGEATLTSTAPPNEWLDLARKIADDDALAHEIWTYDSMSAGGHNSSFSPEDLVSNYLGTVVAARALVAGGTFITEATTQLKTMLASLNVQTDAETRKAFAIISKCWVDSSIGLIDDLYLRRRNFAGTLGTTRDPWKVGHPSDTTTPPWVTQPIVVSATFDFSCSRGFTKAEFDTKIKSIQARASATYKNYDKRTCP